jgi:hypothetical protein
LQRSLQNGKNLFLDGSSIAVAHLRHLYIVLFDFSVIFLILSGLAGAVPAFII